MAENWDSVFSQRSGRGGRSARDYNLFYKQLPTQEPCRKVSVSHGSDQEDAAPASDKPQKELTSLSSLENSTSCSSFVEKSWFQAISAVVIISNVITTIVELDKPETKSFFFVSDQVMLGFYVVELCFRANYFGNLFFLGPCKSVFWNTLDVIVVVAGVLDQWVLPVLPFGRNSKTVSHVLKTLRLLRLLRVFKIVRVFLDIDLSWTEAPLFQSFIGIVILINSLMMGMEIDIPWYGWFWFEQVLLCIYVFELSVRLKNFGTFFFSCSNGDIVWNALDFIIVISSVLDSWVTPLCGVVFKSLTGSEKHEAHHKEEHGMSIGKVMMLMRMLRLMRILRLAKLVKSVRPLYILVTSVIASLQGVAWVLVLTIVTLYAMGILATNLVGKRMAFAPGVHVSDEVLKPFSSVPNSMFTLFLVMSGAATDAEQVAIDRIMDSVPSIKLGFVFFMVTSSWTLLSILTAVVSENMITTTSQQESENKLANAEAYRAEHVQQLKELFRSIDVSGDGLVEQDEIESFLSDKDNALLTARRCRVPVRDVKELLHALAEAHDGGTINLEKFVGNLADLSNVVTEKSVMKLEAKLLKLSRRQTEGFGRLHEMLISSQEKSNNPENLAQVCSKALQQTAEAACKDQLKEVERVMQGFVERTEACLSEIEQKSLGLVESVTKDLKLAFATMNSMPDQELSTESQSILHGTAKFQEVCMRETEVQPIGVHVSQTDAACLTKEPGVQLEFSALQIEALLVATDESIHCLQQKAKTGSEKNSGVLEGCSALAVDKSSQTLESELRVIRQELLLGCGRLSPGVPAVENTSKGDKQLFPLVANQPGIGQLGVVAAQIEAQLRATEESFHGLQQKAETMFGKIEGLFESTVDQRQSALAVDQFPKVLESEGGRESGGQSPEVSKASDRLERGTRSTSIGADQESSVMPILSTVEGD